MTQLPTAETTELLHGTEEWLSTLDDPHDATKSGRRDLPETKDLLDHDDH